MSDWAPGNLALCIRPPQRDEDAPESVDWEPVPGGIYTVAAVWPWTYGNEVILDFEEDPAIDPDAAWEAVSFRKIEAHEPDAEDAETIRLLNRTPVPFDGSLSDALFSEGC